MTSGARVTPALGPPVPILMYHEIAPASETSSRLAVPPEAFAEQVGYLRDAGFETVTAAHLAEIMAGRPGRLPDRPVVLTFDDGFEDFECVDSTKTKLSSILPAKGNKFRFKYEYDFGDGWEHEVLFEGCPTVDPKAKYPLCLEGERACPPEDCGGIWGYADVLEAIRNPKHEEHENMLKWIGPIDPEKFDVKQATKEMKKGLPDWRSMR